jgi:hypothetical protein
MDPHKQQHKRLVFNQRLALQSQSLQQVFIQSNLLAQKALEQLLESQ